MALKPIKVSQLNSYIKRILQTDPLLGNVSVIGEISNLKYHQSGHVYFSLKDSTSKINCFLSSQNLQKLKYELEESMEITAIGNISLYEPGGYYSLNIKDVQVSGVGNLSIAFEKLKNKLEAEGLFDLSHKKSIPTFPKEIVIITAETGAAVKDIIKIISDKNDYVNLLIYPVTVQGPRAAEEIASALDHVNKAFPNTDTIIVGRGGGSIEDLWAFNEEVVARSIYNSNIPVISAVGHEIDFTIADLVADARGETPTAAANMAVPNINDLKVYLNQLKIGLRDRLETNITRKEDRLKSVNIKLFENIINNKIDFLRLKIKGRLETIENKVNYLIDEKEKNIKITMNTLDSLNPSNILKRGYSIATDENGTMLKSVEKLNADDQINLVLADGEISALIKTIRRNNE